MLSQKIAQVTLISFSTSAILFSGTASAQSVNQEINGSAVGPETFVDAKNFTVNPTGSLNQKINCEARNDVVNIDPRCDANNTAIYDSSHTTPHKPHHPHPPIDHPHVPNLNQHVENGGSNTTVIAPSKANSNSNSSSNSHSNANANSKSKSNSNSSSDSNANASVGDVSNGATANTGDQKNRQSVTTGATNVSPSTRVKVDGDKYSNIQFGSQASGTGGEAFSFQYHSACGASIGYRQGFALKPKRIGGGAFGVALDISSTGMDTIESRQGIQNKMDTAFLTAMSVVNSQQDFEQRLNSGTVSRQEAQTRAIANCAPQYPVVRQVDSKKRVVVNYVTKPRTCTAVGCN
ncbi:MAG: hypothetical protein AAF915_30395 [Cyanobacteria bacterium P01_D01_bin.50]